MKHIELPCWVPDLLLILIQVQHICATEEIDGMILIKIEVIPDGKIKQILKDQDSGIISKKIV